MEDSQSINENNLANSGVKRQVINQINCDIQKSESKHVTRASERIGVNKVKIRTNPAVNEVDSDNLEQISAEDPFEGFDTRIEELKP